MCWIPIGAVTPVLCNLTNAFFHRHRSSCSMIFNAATQELSDKQITDAYRDAYQHVPPAKTDSGGQVKITFLKNDKETDWQSDVLEQLPHEIESLQDQGFSLKEIAIVVRWNSEAVRVAETLLTYAQTHTASPYRYDFISNEALLISSAQSVKAVIALMRHFRNPQDNTRRMMAAYEYYRLHRHATPDEALQLYREAGNDFPEEVKHHLHELSSLPFYDMIERFLHSLQVHSKNRRTHMSRLFWTSHLLSAPAPQQIWMLSSTGGTKKDVKRHSSLPKNRTLSD